MNHPFDSHSVVSVSEVLRYLDRDCYLTKAESAEYLGASVRTFEDWMSHIPAYRPSGRLMFRKSELDEFMAAHRIVPSTKVNIAELVDNVVAKVVGDSR